MNSILPVVEASVPAVGRRGWPSLVGIILAVVILYGAGFAHNDSLHHAAHDTRHSAAFPCH